MGTKEQPDGALQGYSPVLNLHLQRKKGQPERHGPATGEHIPAIEIELARADCAEA